MSNFGCCRCPYLPWDPTENSEAGEFWEVKSTHLPAAKVDKHWLKVPCWLTIAGESGFYFFPSPSIEPWNHTSLFGHLDFLVSYSHILFLSVSFTFLTSHQFQVSLACLHFPMSLILILYGLILSKKISMREMQLPSTTPVEMYQFKLFSNLVSEKYCKH